MKNIKKGIKTITEYKTTRNKEPFQLENKRLNLAIEYIYI